MGKDDYAPTTSAEPGRGQGRPPGNDLAARLQVALGDPSSTGATANLAGRIVDWVLAQPVQPYVDHELVADHLIRALAGVAPALLVERHFQAAVERERQRARSSGERLRDYVPPAVVNDLARRLGRPGRLPRGWADGVVDPAFVRTILAEGLADALEDFVSSLPLAGKASGLIGSLTRSAGRGVPRKGPFAQRARDFAAESADRLRERIVERIYAKENAPELGATARRALEAVLSLGTDEALSVADDPGYGAVGGWIAAVVSHNLRRPEIRAAIRDQIREAVLRTGATPIGVFLTEMGLAPDLRNALVHRAAGDAARFFATDAFGDWLRRLLAEDAHQAQEAGSRSTG